MKTVLIVDDFASVRIYHKILLQQAGYATLAAAGGAEALSLLAQGGVDLVVLDLIMPQMSGVEFVSRARALPQYDGLPLIVVSSEAQRQEAGDLQQEFKCSVLQKPVPPQVLLDAVRELLGEAR